MDRRRGPVSADDRRLRLQETMFPFGVGAIVDILGESFIAEDITHWELRHSEPLSCKPLQEALGVSTFRQAPLAKDLQNSKFRALPYKRFPRWRFCESCGALSATVVRRLGRPRNICPRCSGGMVPMRFVAVCAEGGHLQDIPWRLWMHRKAESPAQKECRSDEHMYVRTVPGAGQGLSTVRVGCRACGVERHLGELANEKALEAEGLKCWGTQPWEYTDATREPACDQPLIPVQRGSTSLYMASTTSALDIPETTSIAEDRRSVVLGHFLFHTAKSQDGPARDALVGIIAEEAGVGVDFVTALIEEESGGELAVARAQLLSGEWAAFEKALMGQLPNGSVDFDVVPSNYPVQGSEDPLAPLIDAVGLVRRLREVVALTGFRRYKQQGETRVDLGHRTVLDWYPAIEKYGEGIFIKFDEKSLCAWEHHPGVLDRVGIIEHRAQSRVDPSLLRQGITPRLILIHTFSHLLMRRLEFQSGYSASSLSERIYALPTGGVPQAGLLIHATAGDRLGTLGGLVRLGEADFLGEILVGAVQDADFCSSDPVCAESQGQGMHSLNFAACHACSLVSETSCEHRNVFLDRVLMVGNDRVPGFFQEVLLRARRQLSSD